MILIVLLLFYSMATSADIICYVKDINNDVNLHGHVTLDKEAGKAIGQGLSTIGSQIGLGATMVGVGTAVGKAIAKSSLPPVQKAGVVVGGALIGGFGHSVISAVNRNAVSMENASNTNTLAETTTNVINTANSNISKFINDSTWSPLQELLFDIYGISATCLSLIIILIIQIIFKFYLKDSIKLKLSNILGIKLNSNLEYYINKIILLNKRVSTIYIWLILIIIIIGLSFLIYAANELYTNIDAYINVHNNIKKNEMFILYIMNTNKHRFNIFKRFHKQKKYSSTLCNNLLDKFLKEKKLKPVFLYENLHLDETRKTILKDIKNFSGIYLIFNKVTGDYYIGSASTGRFYARFSNHLLYYKGSKIVKHAVKKYGLSNFAFLILELFSEIVNKENNKKLLDLEDFYLKTLLPNYNILTEAGSSFGYKHTELDRIKMTMNYSIHRRDLIGNLNRNKNLSEETKLKIREKALIRKKVFFSDKALLNMKKKSKAIILYNLDYTVFGEYSSIVEAAKSINCSEKTIRRALKTEKKILKRRFIVKYK